MEFVFLALYLLVHITRAKRPRTKIPSVSHLERKYSKSIENQSTKCSICLNDFHVNDDIVILPCSSKYNIYIYIYI